MGGSEIAGDESTGPNYCIINFPHLMERMGSANKAKAFPPLL
jgi:hypothetical protein